MALNPYTIGLLNGLRPEPDLTVSSWADAHRQLDSTHAAEPGRWRTSRTPYLREIMDALSPSSPYQRVVFMAGAQVGKTECGNNWIGFVIHHAPGPMLMVQPTVEVAKRVSKQRIAPMIAGTPVLRERVREARARDSGNTMFVKEFDGGMLILTGANSSAGLRSMPIRYLFMDEVDAYPGDLEGEGDPVALATKRTTTFARRKLLLTSTPTIRGLSRIEREYLASDQRRFYVPCTACGHMDWMRWENIVWTDDDPTTARLRCVECGERMDERNKAAMMDSGEFRPTAVAVDTRTVGFHVSGLYSPLGWKSWAECVAEFIATHKEPVEFKTFVNTVLGETWEERGDAVTMDTLKSRLEQYPAQVPDGVGVLVAAVDVQGDRLEAVVKGFGAGLESWVVACETIHGDPGTDKVWSDLDVLLQTKFTHQSGRHVTVECAVIDSGGHHTNAVYQYCARRAQRRVFAVRGGSVATAPLVGKASTRNRYNVKLFTLGVDAGKDIVTSRMRITEPGPGFMHLPDWFDDERIAQLTSEKRVTESVGRSRRAVRRWVKVRERNEQFDLEVYALAAVHILGAALIQSLPERAAALAKPDDTPQKVKPHRALRRPWVGKYR